MEVIDVWKDLLDQQIKLNDKIAERLDDRSPFSKMRSNVYDTSRRLWKEELSLALMCEIVEALDNLPWKYWSTDYKKMEYLNKEKLALELIDCLHFNVSLALMKTTFDIEGVISNIVDTDNAFYGDPDKTVAQLLLDMYLLAVHYAGYWDDSAMGLNLYLLIRVTGLSLLEIAEIYRSKLNANLERQNQGYSQSTKTEHDNIKIEEEIKSKLEGD